MTPSSTPERAAHGVVSHDGRPMKYAHGQHAAYVLDRCRCEPCRVSNREYEKDRARRLEPAFVLASQAREHVRWLATQGIGRKQVAKVSGVAHGTLCKLIYGDPQRGSGPSKRIRPATHDAIMAVTPADCGGNCRVISAGPTWALLEEMIAAGVPKSAIAEGLGCKGPGLQLKRTTVSAANRDAVKALHGRWSSGAWCPVRRDRWGNSRSAAPPTPKVVTPEERAEAYDNRMALMLQLAEALEARLDRPWRHLSACRGRPSRLWFPQRGDAETAKAAVSICNACQCRRECLMANLDATDGIYGGMSARARQQLRADLAERPAAAVAVVEHGSVRGYRQHRHNGTDPCAPCREAHALERQFTRPSRAKSAVA